jgi:hypothetical protein
VLGVEVHHQSGRPGIWGADLRIDDPDKHVVEKAVDSRHRTDRVALYKLAKGRVLLWTFSPCRSGIRQEAGSSARAFPSGVEHRGGMLYLDQVLLHV